MKIKLDMVMEVRLGQTVIQNGKRYRVTSIGFRGCGGKNPKYHANSPIECFIESDGRELLAVSQQRGKKRR